MSSPQWRFADFRLDPDNACLWRETQPIALTPKAFDVLHYLVIHPDRLVTKDALLDAVWPELAISDAVVRIAIGELRRALGDTAQAPRFIATVHRRGYRFVAPVAEYIEEGPGAASPAPPVIPQTPLGYPLDTLAPPEAERRQLTVLFCDLVDSTMLAGRLDPEDYREVVRAYHQTCAAVIQQYDGYIAQYLGDGVLVYFGYPQAHEDDAQRAVRTGLGILHALGSLNTRLPLPPGERLAVRLGIHTGLVVVGNIGVGARQEPLALGETPNLGARLQALAAPNTLVISAATWQLLGGFFVCQTLGPKRLHGRAQPLEVYQVLSETTVRSRLEAASRTDLTPLVGREQEIGLLLDRWQQSKDGFGQVILLSGEAGIGKSRLVQVLKDYLAGEPHSLLECHCSPYYTNSPLYPVVDLWQRVLQFKTAEAPADKLRTLEQMLTQYRLPLAETVPLFAALLSLPDDRYPALALTPQRQKQKTLEVLLALLLARAAQEPLLLIVEDLHWVDPSTLEFLSLLIDQAPTARLLTVLPCRPEFHPPWSPRSYLTQLTLGRLGRIQVQAMIERITGGKALPAEMVQQIVVKADGVPLFVEEVIKLVLASGLLREYEAHYELTGPLPPLAIPVTLQDALMARLDQLGSAKVVAQLGATLGRQFAYELLQAVASIDELELGRSLIQLVQAEVLYQRGTLPQATYLFKHALIQEAAHQSLLKSTRQHYHQRIAQVLADRFPDTAEAQPELLAHHYTEAGLAGQAVAYWYKAGQRASERSAHLEAITHLRQGLQLLQTLPEIPERTQREVDLLIVLGASLMATKGFAAPEVGQTYARAQQLCEHLEDPHQLFPVLRGLWNYALARAELQTAHTLGEQLLGLAQQVQDPAMLVAAHRALGTTLFWLGVPASAHTHFAQGMAFYDPSQHRASVFLHGDDSGVVCRSHDAWALWCLGYHDQGLTQSDEALTLAQQVAHPFSLGYALICAAVLHQLRREVHTAQEYAEAAISLAKEQGFPFWMAIGSIMRGWALAHQGQAQDGIEQLHQGLTAYPATGGEINQSYFLALLAEAHGVIGQPEAGLTVLAKVLTLTDVTRVRWYAPESHCLIGELLLQQNSNHEADAETCFLHALDIARSQQAKSFELRTATSLARLWQQQGKRQEAYDLLAPVYKWFTEGFATADLQEAKALLDELA